MFTDNPVETLRVVCVLDPAIDRAETPLTRYTETRDETLVRLLPGSLAFWCQLRPLDIGDFAAVDSTPTGPTKLIQAFRLACEGIENFEGPSLALRPSKMRGGGDGKERPIWGDAELERVYRRLGMAFVYEIGQVAYERATQGNGWGGSVCYTLPLSSVEGLGRIARQLAALARETAGTPSSEKSASDSTPTP
jgi:hypothetical protein